MEESEARDPFEDLAPDVHAAVDGLIYLGELTEEVTFCGHTFGLRTLRADEEIAAAKVVEPFKDTVKAADAWAAANVALALTHVDGDESFCPAAGPSKSSYALARFQYITSNWYQPTIDFLFGAYARLLDKQIEAIRAVQDLSERNLGMFSPSLGSSTEQGTSEEQIRVEEPFSPS